MLSKVKNQFVKVIRSSGQALDSIGRGMEVNPYIEARK